MMLPTKHSSSIIQILHAPNVFHRIACVLKFKWAFQKCFVPYKNAGEERNVKRTLYNTASIKKKKCNCNLQIIYFYKSFMPVSSFKMLQYG